MKSKNLTPIAAGLVIAGVVTLALPGVTAAGLMYAGIALMVLSNLSLKTPATIAVFIIGAVLVDNFVADIGSNLVAMPDLSGLPSVQLNS